MPEALSFTVKPPFRDLRGRFTRATRELLEGRRDMLRRLGQDFIAIERQEAPEGKTGQFKKSLIFRTFNSGNELVLKAYMAKPLGTWIVGGTKPHTIAPRNAGALYFFWPRVGMFTVVPKGGGFRTHASGGRLFVGKGYVNHPGTKPNPFIERSYDRWLPEARVELRRLARNFTIAFRGNA